MPGATAAASPQKMSITSLDTGQSLEVQYNPTEFEDNIAVVYGRLSIPGMSHQQLQYSWTENTKIPLDCNFDALTGRAGSRYDILAARRFVQSLCYAPRGASTIRGGAPPRVLFSWPNLFSLKARVTSVKTKFSRFRADLTPTLLSIHIELEEIRDVRLTSEDVLRLGTNRGGGDDPQE